MNTIETTDFAELYKNHMQQAQRTKKSLNIGINALKNGRKLCGSQRSLFDQVS